MESPRVLIVGSGGHAKVIADILESGGAYAIAGFTSLAPDERLFDYPRLGADTDLAAIHAAGIRHAFVAVGANRARARLLDAVRAAGFELINAVSPHATVSRRARLGRGVAVMPGAVVNADTEIADGAIVNTGATVDHDCRIGPCAHLAPGVHVAGTVTIGEGAFLGAGCAVIPGVRIGAWVTVGAGAAVVSDLPEGVKAVGVPAKRYL